MTMGNQTINQESGLNSSFVDSIVLGFNSNLNPFNSNYVSQDFLFLF